MHQQLSSTEKHTGGMILTPSFCSTSSWPPVKGLSHMNVFIAGATNSGREKSQALNCNMRLNIMSRCDGRQAPIFGTLGGLI